MPRPTSISIFCEVIDNFGDIGVCWRLARQLASEHGLAVTLHVDHLPSFQRLCAEVKTDVACQEIAGVRVLSWKRPAWEPVLGLSDIIVEAFGCRLPDELLSAMAARRPQPVWLNLEYLSAESWVEGCHGMASPHTTLPLVKYFFFPGFTAGTGGLIAERSLAAQRAAFLEDGDDSSRHRCIEALTGHSVESSALRASLFCYPEAPASTLFAAWERSDRPVVCLVPEGVVREQAEAFLGAPAVAGASRRRGALEVCIVPFLSQQDYDRLLWACDVNFVRGEDSFVRAQWAQRPFFWHIYPQQDDAHLVKLDAFLDRYTAVLPVPVAEAVRQSWHAWNGTPAGSSGNGEWWTAFAGAMPSLDAHGQRWANNLWRNGDLAGNLVKFAEKIG